MISVKESKVLFRLGGSSPFSTDLSDEFPGVDYFEVQAHMSSSSDQRGVNVDVTQNIVFMVVIKSPNARDPGWSLEQISKFICFLGISEREHK